MKTNTKSPPLLHQPFVVPERSDLRANGSGQHQGKPDGERGRRASPLRNRSLAETETLVLALFYPMPTPKNWAPANRIWLPVAQIAPPPDSKALSCPLIDRRLPL